MLVLSRRQGEQVLVGENIVITICTTHRGHVRLGITAPPDVRIVREEISEPATAFHEPCPRLDAAV